MSATKWVAIGACSAALAVGLGAFAAHGLEGKLSEESLDSFEVGVRYHLYHSLGLILLGILAERWNGRWIPTAAALLLAGILLFSGGLYVWSLTEIRVVVHFVPVGGMAFLVGWIVLAVVTARRPGRSER